MTLRQITLSLSVAVFAALALAACVTPPEVRVAREPLPAQVATAGTPAAAPANEVPAAQLRRGDGVMLDTRAASAPPPNLTARSGQATFNFEGESLPAVVKAILGDLLGQNYVIAPGVQGTVTLATPRPVSPAQALSLLDMVLAWNNARMVYADGRYNIVPADAALAGMLVPRYGSPALARGYEVRVVPLKYVGVEEMARLLKPYARTNAIVATDPARNLITLAGTRSELENYLRTIDVFDVDWMKGMSVGVFPLSTGRASDVVADLEKIFGESSKTPLAGMFRFMPLEGANAVLVITPQPAYLDQIQQWLDRIDSAGGGERLYSYALKYIKARELADRLSEVFGGGAGGGRSGGGASLAPGATPVNLSDSGATAGGTGGGRVDSSLGGGAVSDAGGGLGATPGTGGTSGGLGSGSLSLGQAGNGNGSVQLEVNGSRVGVAAVEETNTLLVRANPAAWRSIRDVVERLDVMPMQVHIEAQVAEVQLTGALQYGVSWYFDNPFGGAPVGLPSNAGVRALEGATAAGGGLAWTFVNGGATAILGALDSITNVRILQSPSVLVRNNAEATFNVGSRIPVATVTVNPGTGSTNTLSSVQYLDTGTILKVRPRVTQDGIVFLDIVQEVSTPGTVADINGNVRIDTRRLKTEAAVQSGQTVLLAGLIDDNVTSGSSGLPGLSRIPVIGALFGRQTSNNTRNEVVVLITPTIVRNPQDARRLTDEYSQRFRALQPIKPVAAPQP
jgi:general secretion pathway protein D